jgi:hypothetical protein
LTKLSKHLTASMAAATLATLVGVPALASPTTSIVPNASFAKIVAGKPDCWGAAGATSVLSVVGGHFGRVGVQLRGKPANTRPLEWRSEQSAGCGTPVTVDHSYTIGAWYQATSMVRPVVYTFSRAAGWTKWFTGGPYSATTDWDKLESTTPPVPAGTEQIGLGFAADGTAKLVLADVSLDDATAAADPAAGRAAPFHASFAERTTLITNEYAYWNPKHADAVRSPIWSVTSGSLFSQARTGYTGKIDDGRPDARSTTNTDSSTFRLETVRRDFADVNVAFRLNIAELASTRRTPAVSYDGVHIWLRHESQYSLYAASVARRDGKVVIKKKCRGGPSNDGTYYPLGKEISGAPITLDAWTSVAASVRTNPSGSVTVTLSVGGKVLVTAVDTGIGCAPITGPGAVGVRGDNTRFSFKTFGVTAL